MADIARTAEDMISNMSPELRGGEYVFITTKDGALAASLAPDAISTFMEDEGQSLVLPVELATERGLNADQPMRCITLNVLSSLEGVGLTAAVATVLGEDGIPCNMIAAYHHDHAFVPSAMAERALHLLKSLQGRGGVRD